MSNINNSKISKKSTFSRPGMTDIELNLNYEKMNLFIKCIIDQNLDWLLEAKKYYWECECELNIWPFCMQTEVFG